MRRFFYWTGVSVITAYLIGLAALMLYFYLTDMGLDPS